MTPQEKAQKAYDDYYSVLRNGEVTADTIKQAYGEIDPGHVQRVLKIKTELDAQQSAGSKDYYSTGSVSVENATWDMAFRLAETGISSVQNMERKIVNVDNTDSEFGQASIQDIRYFNKETGQDITDTWNRVSQDNPMKTNYNLHFTDDGMVMPYTSRKSSSWVEFRDSTLKPIAGIALAAYGVPYVSTALGATTAGASLVAAGGQAALTAASSAIVAGGTTLVSGGDFEDALKNALVGGLTAGAAAGYADTIGQTFGFDAGSVASKAAGNAVVAAVKAGVTDENVLESMVKAALSTAMASQNDGVIKAADEDLAAGLNPEYGSNQTYDAFMSESMRTTNTYNSENQNFDTDEMGRAGQFGDAYNADNAFDATASEGSLAKPTDEGFKFDTKDLKTAIKIGGVLMAGDAVIDKTIGSNTSLGAKREDPWRNAPIDGFRMAKFEDPATGKFKYVPFVKDSALLPPPAGYKEIDYYAKGGFVTKRN